MNEKRHTWREGARGEGRNGEGRQGDGHRACG
jgi:hypothetical protein